MKSKQFRVLTENGTKYSFNAEQFAVILNERKVSTKMSLEELYSMIADRTGYSTDAVKKWKLGCNGVSDVETVKKLAEVLEVNYFQLIKPVKDTEEYAMNNEKNNMMPVENNAMGCIYATMLAYIREFNTTWGFSICYCDDIQEARDYRKEYYDHFKNVSNVVYNYALNINDDAYQKILRLLEDLEKLVVPLDFDMNEMTYVPDIWTENNENLNKLANQWSDICECYETVESEGGLTTSEDIFDKYCDELTREFIKRFKAIKASYNG